MKAGHIQDELVVYHSKEDDCWICHGLHTDQIGTGDCIVDAMADCIRAITAVARLAAQDKTIAFFREAPDEVKAICKKAKKLSAELCEIAQKKAVGEWPADISVDALPDKIASTVRAELAEV